LLFNDFLVVQKKVFSLPLLKTYLRSVRSFGLIEEVLQGLEFLQDFFLTIWETQNRSDKEDKEVESGEDTQSFEEESRKKKKFVAVVTTSRGGKLKHLSRVKILKTMKKKPNLTMYKKSKNTLISQEHSKIRKWNEINIFYTWTIPTLTLFRVVLVNTTQTTYNWPSKSTLVI